MGRRMPPLAMVGTQWDGNVLRFSVTTRTAGPSLSNCASPGEGKGGIEASGAGWHAGG